MSDFSKAKNRKDGLQPYCKLCSNRKTADTMNKLSDAEYLHNMAKRRCKRTSREFGVTVKDVSQVDTDVCPILGIPIKRYLNTPNSGNNRGVSGIPNDSKTLDRIDPTKGYIPGNIQVISWRANLLKKDMTLEELAAFSNYYLSTIV